MNEDYKKLYDAVSSRFDIGDYESFQSKMQTPEDRKRFYNVVSEKGFDLGDYESYENRLSVGGDSVGKPQETSGEGSQTPATPSYESGERVEETIDFNAVKYGIKPPRKTEQQQDETQVKGAIASFKPPSPLELRRGETEEEYQIRKNQDLILNQKKQIDEQLNSIAIGFDEAQKNIEKLNSLTEELNAIKPPQGVPTPSQIKNITDEITTLSSELDKKTKSVEQKYSSLFSELESIPKNEKGEYIIDDEKTSKRIQSQLNDYNEEIKPLQESQSRLNELINEQNKSVNTYNAWFSENYPLDKAEEAARLFKEYEGFKSVESEGKKRYEQLAEEKAKLMSSEVTLQSRKEAINDEKIQEFRRDLIQNLPISQQAGMYLFGALKMGTENIVGSLAISQSRQSNNILSQQDQTKNIDFNAVKYGIKPTKEQDLSLRKNVYEWGQKMYEKSKKTEADYGLVTSLENVDNPLDLLSFALTSIAEQAPQIPLAITTFGGSTYFQELGGMHQEIVQYLMDERGMTLEEALNSDEANKMATNLTALGIASLDMLGLVGQFGGKVLLGNVIKSGIKQSAVDRIILGTTSELATETGQEFLAKGGVSQAKGSGFIEGMKEMTSDEIKDLWAKVLFSSGTFTSVNTLISGKVNKDNIETLNEASTKPEVLNNLTNHIQSLSAANVISTEEADRQIAELNAKVQANLQIPEDIQGEKRAKLVELQQKYDETVENQKRASPAFKAAFKQNLDDIQAQMEAIISETETTQKAVEEDVVIAEDEITALEQEIAQEEERLSKEKEPTKTEDTKQEPQTLVTPKALDFLGKEVVDENGNVGTIKQEGEGRLVFESEDRILELGSADNVADVTLAEYGLSVKPEEITDGTTVEKKQTKEGQRVVPQTKTEGAEETTEAVMQEEEYLEKTNKELEEMEKKAEEDVKAFEKIALEEAAKKSTNKDLVQVGENIFQVTKKDDGTFTVSQMREDGRLIPIGEKNTNRNKAIGAFKSKKSNTERRALAEAQKLVDEFKQGEQDKILNWLDQAINATSNQGRAYDATLGIPMFVANSSLKVLRAAYKAGKTLAEAINDAIEHIKKQGYTPNELEYKKFVLNELKNKGNAKKQQARQVRKKGEQVQAEETGVGDMREIDQTETTQEEKISKKVQTAKNNLKKAFSDFIAEQQKTGIAFDAKEKARQALKQDKALAKAIFDFIYANAELGVYNAQKLMNDLIGQGIDVTKDVAQFLIDEATKQRRGKIKTINKKKGQVIKRFKRGGFFASSPIVSAFVNSIPQVSKITNSELLEKIDNELSALLRSKVADVDTQRIESLIKEMNDAVLSEDKRTPLQKAESLISGLKQKAKNITNISGVVAFELDIDRAQTELDNALQQGFFGDIDQDTDGAKRYEELQQKIIDAIGEMASPKKADSYKLLVSFKGNTTRVKNRINQALKNGEITQQKADELISNLEEAKKKFDKENNDFIENRSKEAKSLLSGMSAEDVSKEHGLSKPARIIIEGFFNQIKKYAPKTAADAETFYKIADALSKGFIPYFEIGQIIKNTASDTASAALAPSISKVIDKVKKMSSVEVQRLLGETLGAIKSEELGIEFSKEKTFEDHIYTPIQEAIKKADKESLEMAKRFEEKLKKAHGGFFKRSLDRIRGKNNPRRAALKVGIIKNMLNEYAMKGMGLTSGFQIENMASDGSMVEVGERDWLGIILGKEVALNDLKGEVKEQTRKAILAGKLSLPFKQKLGVFGKLGRKLFGFTGYKQLDLEIMNDIWESLPKKPNGAVDFEAVANNPAALMTDLEKGYYDAVTDAFNESFEFIQVANMVKGLPIETLDDYYKRSRLNPSDKELSYTEAGIYSNNLRIKAGSANIRTSNAVGAIDFNAINVATQNIVESPRYFYIDQAGRTVNSTLSKTAQQTEHTNVVSGIKQDVAASLIYNYKESNQKKIFSRLISARYAYSLADPLRAFFIETGSMVWRALIQNRGAFKSILSPKKRKVFSKLERDLGMDLQKKVTGQIETKTSLRSLRGKNDKPIAKESYIGRTINFIMSVPENITGIGFFLPIFNQNFTELTGKSFDENAYLNDPNYVKENEEFIKKAANRAATDLEKVVGSPTKFGDRRYVRFAPKFLDEAFNMKFSTPSDEFTGRWLAFMGNYIYREGRVFFRPIKELIQTGKVSGESISGSAGVLVAGIFFTYMQGLYYNASKMLFGDDDDKEKAKEDMKETYGVDITKDYTDPENIKNMLSKMGGVAIDQTFYYGTSGRYGQLIRTASIAGLSIMYDFADDAGNEYWKKQFKDALKTKYYSDPVMLNSYSLQAFASKNVPVLDMGVKVFTSMYQNYQEIVKKYPDFWDRVKTMDFEGDEKDFLIAYSTMFATLNTYLAFKYGAQIPMTSKVNNIIRNELKKEESTQNPKIKQPKIKGLSTPKIKQPKIN